MRARANYRLLSTLGPKALLAQCVQLCGTRALGLQPGLDVRLMSRNEHPARWSSLLRRYVEDLVLVRARLLDWHQQQIQPVASNKGAQRVAEDHP